MHRENFFFIYVRKNKFIYLNNLVLKKIKQILIKNLTIHYDFHILYFLLSDDTNCLLELIDTPGGEKFRKNFTPLLNKSDTIILMYNINAKKSFEAISDFNKLIKDNSNEDIKVLLLGNKSSLIEKREVSFEEGKSLAKLNNYAFMEVSLKDIESIKDAIEIAISLGLIRNNSLKFRDTTPFQLISEKKFSEQKCF